MGALDRGALKLGRLLCALSVLGFLQTRGALCTTIVGARTEAEVVISADSKVDVRFDGQSIGHIVGCKIFAVGGILVANSGHPVIGGFSLRDLALAHLSGGGAPLARVNGFYSALSTQLRKALATTKEQRPAMFDSLVGAGVPVLALIVAYWDSNGPVIEFIHYDSKIESESKVRAGVSVQSHLRTCPGYCKAPEVPYFAAAGSLAAVRGMLLRKEPTSPARLPALLQEMVETEIKADPANVGGPVSTVILDSTGPHWFQDQHGACPAELN